MYYLVRHITRYDYATPIRENIMTLRVHPRSDGNQRCLSFDLSVTPGTRILNYRDFLGNVVHHFDVPAPHSELVIVAEALVETLKSKPVPQRLPSETWGTLDEIVETEDYWEMLLPSRFAVPGTKLKTFMSEFGLSRDASDPLSLARRAMSTIFENFEYDPDTTVVDSEIDEALTARRGVCQDFAHILIAMLRELKIPARYVSGYVYHREIRDALRTDDGTHAWVEALMPGLGWVGFDPTSNLVCGGRHIRTAIGRDYADVPPTAGVYRGETPSELGVYVKVWPWGSGLRTSAPDTFPTDALPQPLRRLAAAEPSGTSAEALRRQQQQQQQ